MIVQAIGSPSRLYASPNRHSPRWRRDERVRAFGSLAESARRNGNLLGDDLVQRVIGLTMAEKDLVLQAAASKALGALDLPSNKASEIIRAQSRD